MFYFESQSSTKIILQGATVFPLYIILCADILATFIKLNKDIKSTCLNNTDYKISQDADKASLVLDGSSKSLFAALDTIAFFYFSGLKINN